MSASDPATAADPTARTSGEAPLFPRKPAEPARDGGGWVVGGLIAVLLIGLVAAGVVFGPRLMAANSRAAPRTARPPATAAAAASATRPVPAAAAPATPASALAAAEPVAPPPASDVGRLTADIERLMTERYAAQAGEQARAVQAAEAAAARREQALLAQIQQAQAALDASRRSSAVAAGEVTGLIDAAFGDRPFVAQAAALVRRLPGNADAEALLALSATGAPSRAGLVDQFERVEIAAARASRRPGGRWDDQLLHVLTGGAVLRRTDAAASGSDGALARAAARVRSGDLAGAAGELERAPAPVPQVTAGWRDAVRRRLEIDRRMAAVRDAALSAVAGPQPAPATSTLPTLPPAASPPPVAPVTGPVP